MAVSKWNSHPIGSKIAKAVNGICGETGLGLFAVRYHRRTCGFEPVDGVTQSGIIEFVHFTLCNPSGREPPHSFDESLGPGNASDGFGWDHRSSPCRIDANHADYLNCTTKESIRDGFARIPAMQVSRRGSTTYSFRSRISDSFACCAAVSVFLMRTISEI